MSIVVGARYRHVKTGREYKPTGLAMAQMSSVAADCREHLERISWVVYKDESGQMFVRPEREFLDGRFERVK